MPYRTVRDLPPSVRSHLPPAAQVMYRAVFNNAWKEYGARADRETLAHRVAWAAVKKQFRKQGTRWIRRQV
jgi:cation transport regulator